ncbi:MAG: tRNA 2-thiocytidine biosynthesis TtcA family protein [Negativicutes bacterium]
MELKDYLARIWRAIIEFELLAENDSILIGLSGGKDSLFMTYALREIQKYAPFNFHLGVYTMDGMFSNNFPTDQLQTFCSTLNLPFHSEQINIKSIIEKQNGKDPCYSCAFFRRGAINNYAKKNGYNKVAYAHHNDDFVETFLMNILQSGQLGTFQPKTYLDRSGITVIRPLCYLREHELLNTHVITGILPIKNPCPFDGKTKRQETKELIKLLEKTNHDLYSHLNSAMRQDKPPQLWPPAFSKAQSRTLFCKFWKK